LDNEPRAATGLGDEMVGKQTGTATATGCLLTVQMSGWHTLEPMPQKVMASQAIEMVYRILSPGLLKFGKKEN
jgi:hypothetical protein